MDSKIPFEKLMDELTNWVNKAGASPGERARLARRVSDELASRLSEEAPDTCHIAAPNAVVEVIDEASGHLYRRYLEVEYDESDNGLRLMGEDVAANPAQIVFLSEAALFRMRELRGGGPDEPRCHD